MDALVLRDEAFRKEISSNQHNLEFLALTTRCHLVNKEGDEVTLETLRSNSIVGIYFSAHRFGPCRSFTPKLTETYNRCKDEGKAFEVIFVSSDESRAEFDEHYSMMPWCALSYDDRAMGDILSQHFNVEGKHFRVVGVIGIFKLV